MKILDDEFLPSLPMDDITFKMVKESVEYAHSSLTLFTAIKEKITLEFYLLQNHLNLNLTDIYMLKKNVMKSAQPHRLMLTATRCIFRNIQITKKNEVRNDMTKKNEITATGRKATDGNEIFKIDSTIYSCSQSYKAFCTTATELFSSVENIISELEQLRRTDNTAVRTSPENENTTSQCEELFEFTRSLDNPFGGTSLIVEDLPAATKIWSTEKKSTISTTSNTAKDIKMKMKMKSDVGGILNSYQGLSSMKEDSSATADIINLKKKIRKEINMKIFTEKAENFLVQKIYDPGFDYFFKIFQSLRQQTNLEDEKNYEKLSNSLEGVLESSESFTSMRLQFLEESCRIGFMIEKRNSELLQTASKYFILELIPPLPSIEDMQAIVKIRKNEMLQRCLEKDFPTKIGIISYSFEGVATRLLRASSVFSLNKYQYYGELIKAVQGWKEGKDNAILLCVAFLYEESSVGQVTKLNNMISNPTSKQHALQSATQNKKQSDYFLSAISQGARFLSLNWTPGNPLCVNSACLSPETYIIILEKYVVMLLLYSKQCENVIIPTSLLLDVFCCQNSAYASMIRCCLMNCIFSYEKKREMIEEMTKLIGPLILLLSAGYESIKSWVKQSMINKNSRSQTEKETERVMSILMRRSYSLLLTLILNENDRHTKINNILKLENCLRASASPKMNPLLTKLTSRTSPQEYVDFFKSIHDPMVLTTIREENSGNQNLKLQQAFLFVETIGEKDFINVTIRPYVPKPDTDYKTIGQAVKILKRPEKKVESMMIPVEKEDENGGKDVTTVNASKFEFSASADDSLNLPPPPPPPPSSLKMKDSYSVRCYKIFKSELEEARDRIKNFTNKDIYSRQLEHQFRQISTKFQRNHIFVKTYLDQIMPLLMDVRYYSNVIEFLGQSDIEV